MVAKGCFTHRATGALIFAFIVLADQITKALVCKFLADGSGGTLCASNETVHICDFLNIVLVTNKGISFGMLNNGAPWQLAIVYSGILLTCLWLFFKYWQARSVTQAMAPALMLAGAAGNVLDRIVHGVVIDFIDFYIKSCSIPLVNITIRDWHWPAFNVADAAVVCGAAVLFFVTVRDR
jgi:signal peptidase II